MKTYQHSACETHTTPTQRHTTPTPHTTLPLVWFGILVSTYSGFSFKAGEVLSALTPHFNTLNSCCMNCTGYNCMHTSAGCTEPIAESVWVKHAVLKFQEVHGAGRISFTKVLSYVRIWRQNWCSEDVQEHKKKKQARLKLHVLKNMRVGCVRACVRVYMCVRAPRVKRHNLSMFTARHASPRASHQGLRYQWCPRFLNLHLRAPLHRAGRSAPSQKSPSAPGEVAPPVELAARFQCTRHTQAPPHCLLKYDMIAVEDQGVQLYQETRNDS
jgi:hypothetical protein